MAADRQHVPHGVDACRASGTDFMITIGGSSRDTGKGSSRAPS